LQSFVETIASTIAHSRAVRINSCSFNAVMRLSGKRTTRHCSIGLVSL